MANESKVQELKNGQFIITIPRAIAESLRLKKSDIVEWLHIDGNFIIRKV